MKRANTARCSAPDCEHEAKLKGLCRRHYMAKYNRRYYDGNRPEILEHLRKVRCSKQSD